MRRFLPLLAALGLAACFDADIALDFVDAETMEATVETRIVRSMFDMSGDSPEDACDGGVPEITTEHLICRETHRVPVAALFDPAADPQARGQFDPTEGASFERVDDVTVKVTFDFQQMIEDEDPLPPEMEGMDDMLSAMFAGHSLVFRVRGYRIINTTGTLNADETEASRVLPLAQLMMQGEQAQQPFVTVVQLEPDCVLGIFCD